MKKSDEKTKGTSTSRREFLKKAGVTAALTPPAMVLLSRPSSASIVKSGMGNGGDYREYDRPVMRKNVARSEGGHGERSREERGHRERSREERGHERDT